MLIFTDNEKQLNFINNEFKQISFENRKYIFGYSDINKGGDFVQFFNPKSTSINMKLIIFDFKNSRYYIHNKELDVNKKPIERSVAEINYLIENIDKLNFHSGDFLEELFRFLDIKTFQENAALTVGSSTSIIEGGAHDVILKNKNINSNQQEN